MQILEMNLDDFEQIKDCLQEEFDEFWTPNILKSELESPNSKYIIAKENENIVGFAGIIILIDDTEITNIVTKKTERKRGIGTLLLDKLIEMTKKENRDKISLEVNENNIEAKNLYIKNGFEMVGRRKKYYNGIDDAIIMTKFL